MDECKLSRTSSQVGLEYRLDLERAKHLHASEMSIQMWKVSIQGKRLELHIGAVIHSIQTNQSSSKHLVVDVVIVIHFPLRS